jgi:hypothetical protein
VPPMPAISINHVSSHANDLERSDRSVQTYLRDSTDDRTALFRAGVTLYLDRRDDGVDPLAVRGRCGRGLGTADPTSGTP